MSFIYESDNIKDNEKRKFQPDTNNEVAVNVRSYDLATLLEQILIALGGSVATLPQIFNVDCEFADTEYSQLLPAGTKGFIVKARGNSKVQFYYQAASSTFLTISPGASFEDKNFYNSQTVYFKCSKADEVIEIVAFI